MNTKEVAEKMNGQERRFELDNVSQKDLREHGIVVVFAHSDDNMEFRGAINEEIGCDDGGEAYVTREGLLATECDGRECPHLQKLLEKATKIEALWCKEEPYAWTYKTDIPHVTFDIMSEGDRWCRGIAFNLKDVPQQVNYPELRKILMEDIIGAADTSKRHVEDVVLSDGRLAQITIQITRDEDEMI